MVRRYSSLMLVLGIAACSKPTTHAPNSDTVALLRTVLKYAADSLYLGPRIIVARSTKSTPSIRLSLATQNAIVSSDTTLSAVDRYDSAVQVCDTVAVTNTFCHFPNANGLVAVTDIRIWRDSARVEFEYYKTMTMLSVGAGVDSATNANVKGKKDLVYDAGGASLARDVSGHWQVKKFTEAPFGDGDREGAKR